ncbi:2-dehydro-3-deoxygalactonokinase [Celeribacter litoreus]|uniref:2-dehydro-3-deoxygalactonokinase n=1 Tax=Celeribacter litoreus TaxID=2876714 RepID=UPI001CCE1A2F|nr:2-dehydro-3-deoxygalactonokinase [Celeribacter litoreus]MCA0044853.1 2-dehydro-3-deoxygalactonokinase [Celeribacter litoreus]
MTVRIAVDWGTSALRLWVLGEDGNVRAERRSDDGMGKLRAEDFEPAFLALARDLIEGAEHVEVVICGMAGARTGWAEAAYLPVPCQPVGKGAITVETQDKRLSVRILPGLSQTTPADVMRGEETQIVGFLSANPSFDGVLCLPGTHSKWVRIENGEVTFFQTMMTGELFALLSKSSVLRLSMDDADAWSEEAFADGVQTALNAPAQSMAALFSLRAEGLLGTVPEGEARSKLSGLLIGQELAAMRGLWTAYPVALIGAKDLSARYAKALRLCGVEVKCADGDTMVLDGLRAAFEKWGEL